MIVPRLCASSPRKRIASGEKPPQTSLMSTSTSCPPSSAAWYLAVRAAPSLRLSLSAPPTSVWTMSGTWVILLVLTAFSLSPRR